MPETQGHVALYARDARWRRAVAKALAAAGHSLSATAEPLELQRLLLSQRFDLLALKVHDESEAQAIADALKDAPLPPHKIIAGSVSALPLIQQYHRDGTFRFTPGLLSQDKLLRLVDASLSSGSWQDSALENGVSSGIEEVDLEEVIDNAAAQVHAQAKKRRQRFSTVIEGPSTEALANPARLLRTLTTVLELVISLSPRGVMISVDARAQGDDWTIKVSAPGGNGHANTLARLTEALESRNETLRSAYRDISAQGGLLWVELSRAAALAVCMSLPVATELSRTAQREVEAV